MVGGIIFLFEKKRVEMVERQEVQVLVSKEKLVRGDLEIKKVGMLKGEQALTKVTRGEQSKDMRRLRLDQEQEREVRKMLRSKSLPHVDLKRFKLLKQASNSSQMSQVDCHSNI